MLMDKTLRYFFGLIVLLSTVQSVKTTENSNFLSRSLDSMGNSLDNAGKNAVSFIGNELNGLAAGFTTDAGNDYANGLRGNTTEAVRLAFKYRKKSDQTNPDADDKTSLAYEGYSLVKSCMPKRMQSGCDFFEDKAGRVKNAVVGYLYTTKNSKRNTMLNGMAYLSSGIIDAYALNKAVGGQESFKDIAVIVFAENAAVGACRASGFDLGRGEALVAYAVKRAVDDLYFEKDLHNGYTILNKAKEHQTKEAVAEAVSNKLLCKQEIED